MASGGGYHISSTPCESDLVGVFYPSLPNKGALNSTTVPSFQLSGPFHYGLTNVNDHYSKVDEPWQPTVVLPLLDEAELLTSSTVFDQPGTTTYNVGNAVPQSENFTYDVCNAVPQYGNSTYDGGNALLQSGNNIYGVDNAVAQPGNTTFDVGNAVPQFGITIYNVGNAVPRFRNTTYDVGNAVPQFGNTTYDVGNAVAQPGNTTYHVDNAVPQFGITTYDVSNAVAQFKNTTYDVGNAVPQSGNTIYDVGNVVSLSYMPLLSQSTFLGLSIDATDEVSIAPPPHHSTAVNEKLHHNSTSSEGLHGPIQNTEQPNTCQKCTQSFPSIAKLERHAKQYKHDAFKCKCGNPYARLDNLKRHWDQTPKFPCPHCSKYTGAKAFIREDHLTQHLHTEKG